VFGDPSSFRLVERDLGAPGPGEVRLRIHAAGISFVDVLIAEGGYQIKPDLPFVPGSDVSGVIDAVGAGVSPSRIGERVCAVGFGNAFAEAALFPEAAAHRMPDKMSFEEGSVLLASYTTSYHALVQRAQLERGETLLVLGAAGAVGYAACEIGKALGAQVIASASTDEKRELAKRAGADAVVDSRSCTWRDDVKRANGGKPLDVVFDPVGDVFTEPAFRSLGWKGRLLVVGFAGGSIAKLPANLALLKGAAMIGVNVSAFDELQPDLAQQNIQDLFSLYEQDKIHPPIARVFPLDDFAEAMMLSRRGQLAGRVVLKMRD
jgi:NADPH2:quinone reductase